MHKKMHKKSIAYNLIISFTAVTGAVLILVGTIISIWFNREYTKQRTNILEKQVDLIEYASISYLNQNTETSYEDLQLVMRIIENETQMRSMVIDNQGYIYAVSDKDLEQYKYTKAEGADNWLDSIKKGESKRFKYNKDGVEFEGYIKPITYKEYSSGAILMLGNYKYIKAPIKIYIVIWLSVVLALVLASFIMNYFVRKILVNHIEEINNAAKRFARGDVEKRLIIKSDNEIGELAESFNIMASSLEAVDLKRKEFISNVSHELRSPITSIKGFISGIIDGVIPKDRENYYLNVVNDEVSRLARLVNDLLDISSMEAGKFKLIKSQLDINQIITLCILNLESKIKEKMINVEVTFHDRYEYAIGDRDRLIQVITNLVENAIKYGSEKGQIKIDTYKKADKVYVSIFNIGPNLSNEE
ncbi:MAG: histidine kinase dimerization/phospho-acceptor domain-containing protein, partial [Clostridium sp.]